MFDWSHILLVAFAVVLGGSWRHQTRHVDELRRRLDAMTRDADRLVPIRANLRNERRRVRRSHRLKRRAQRVVAMVRTLAGTVDVTEAARRGSGAIVDVFGARCAALWTVDELPVCLAAAGQESGAEFPGAGGRKSDYVLEDDDRQPVAQLFVEFDGGRGDTTGLESYVKVLGVVLGACRTRLSDDGSFEIVNMPTALDQRAEAA